MQAYPRRAREALHAPLARDLVRLAVAGGRIGRTCHRAGPVIAIGRSGCDINFSSDAQLAARHAEVRLGDDGSVALVDLGQGQTGVFVRVRAQQHIELTGGDIVQLGDQLLRVEVG